MAAEPWEHRPEPIDFARRWYGRALEYEDPFDRFFSLWIAFVVAAKHAWPKPSPPPNTGDQPVVGEYLVTYAPAVFSTLQTTEAETCRWFSERKGTTQDTPIVDAFNDTAEEQFRRLSRCWGGEWKIDQIKHARYVAHLLCRIRNNVFHGYKVYEDDSDILVLEHTNRLLCAILRATSAVT